MKRSKLEKINVQFFNLWSHIYDSRLFGLLRKLQQKTINSLNISEGDSILDVGAGTGQSLLLLSQRTKGLLAGLDLSPRMIARAKKKTKHLPNMELKRGNAEQIPWPDSRFDIVLCTEAFHHFPDPRQAVREMKRVLKPGGQLVITDISFKRGHRLMNIIFKIEPGFVKLYSQDDFQKLFVQAGFSNIEFQHFNFYSLIFKGIK